MAEVLPMPARGDVFVDERGDERTMRVSLHADRGVVVLSIWSGPSCRASFRLPTADADRLAVLLRPAPTAAPEVTEQAS
jgi:hypothetical protein